MLSVTILRLDPDTDHSAHGVDQGEHHLPLPLQHLEHVPGAVHWAVIDVSHNISRSDPGLVSRRVLHNSAIITNLIHNSEPQI